MNRDEVNQLIREAKFRNSITWKEIAKAINKSEAWTVAAVLGQHPLSLEDSKTLIELLGLDPKIESMLCIPQYRGGGELKIPSDPTIYRFYEALSVYGPALKELIYEEFGDGIMSAINFSLDVERKPDPTGDRVVVTLNGKFLPYEWK